MRMLMSILALSFHYSKSSIRANDTQSDILLPVKHLLSLSSLRTIFDGDLSLFLWYNPVGQCFKHERGLFVYFIAMYRKMMQSMVHLADNSFRDKYNPYI